jgi:hypothetical protein
MRIGLIFVLYLAFSGTDMAVAQSDNVREAIRFIVLFCVAGGVNILNCLERGKVLPHLH